MESDQSRSGGPHQDAVYVAVDEFLHTLLQVVPMMPDLVLRQRIVGFLGTAELRPGGHRAQHPDGPGWADLRVDEGRAVVRVDHQGGQLQFEIDLIEARACLLAANATATAAKYVRRVFDDVLAELEHQIQQFAAGLEPTHPSERAPSTTDAAPSDIDGCRHSAMPPPGDVPPFSMRTCPQCGTRMRAYPANVTEGGDPEWQEVPE